MKTPKFIWSSIRFGSLAALLSLSNLANAQWVAFNSHNPGAGNNQWTTIYRIPVVAGVVASGPLTNITTGAQLPATLTITTNGTVNITTGTASGTPGTGTPAYNTFNGFCMFGTAAGPANSAVQTPLNSMVVYTFTGLDVTKTYKFHGTASRGGAASNYTNRWEVYTINGATAFTAVPSSTNCYSIVDEPANIAANQLVFNAGTNTNGPPANGDMVEWDSIVPGVGGTFSVTCTRYAGPLPAPNDAVGAPTAAPYSYALTAVRLEEVASVTPVAPSFANATDPTNRTVAQCGSTTFTAGIASGNPTPTYQWYKNNISNPIGGATSASYTIASVQPTDAADYFVRAHNTLGDAESHHATLTVTPAPAFTLVRAIAPDYSVVAGIETTNRTVIRISMSAPIDAATVSAAGFTVKERSSATTVAVSSATVTNGTNIHIVTAARTADVNYDVVLGAPGVGNTCTSTKVTGTFNVALPVLLLDPDPTHMWRYLDNGVDPGAGWQNVGFNDSAWPQGLAVFDTKRPSRTEITNTPVRTMMALTNVGTAPFTNDISTYNFRTHFSLPGVPVALQAITFFDDGGAIFINGAEGFRLRDASGLAYTAYGPGAPTGETEYEGPFDLPNTGLASGDNLVAVELKNSSITSSDATMGLRLIGYYNSVGPRLTLAGPDFFGDFSLTWAAGTLQDSSSPAGPWHDVASASSPFAFNPTELGAGSTKRFFRLR